MSKFIFVYKITNLINGKFYYGKHATNNLNDRYLGSGVLIKKAIKKYGKENFQLKILRFFDSEKDAFNFERVLVNSNTVNDDKCYNLVEGGKGLSSDSAKLLNTAKHLVEYSRTVEAKNRARNRMKDLMSSEYMKSCARNNLNKINNDKEFIKRRAERVKKVLIPYSKSIEGRESASKRMKQYLRTEEGKMHCIEHGIELMRKFNSSQRHHDVVVNSNKNRVITDATRKLHSKNTQEFNKLYPERVREKQELAALARYYNVVKLIEGNVVNKLSYQKARNLSDKNKRSLPLWDSLIKKFGSVSKFVSTINLIFNESFTYED